MSKYEFELGTFNGHDYVKIWELDRNNVRYRDPVMSIGKKKLLMIEENLTELKQLLGLIPSKPRVSMDVNVEEDIPF